MPNFNMKSMIKAHMNHVHNRYREVENSQEIYEGETIDNLKKRLDELEQCGENIYDDY